MTTTSHLRLTAAISAGGSGAGLPDYHRAGALGDSVATSLATHQLRQPARLLARIAPFWLAFIVLASLAVSIIIFAVAVTADDPDAVPLLTALLSGIVFWTLLIMLAKPWLSYVRVVHELVDGSLGLTTIFGRHEVLRAGDVLDVREQQLVPQPGITRVRTVHGRRYYLGPFEHKYALVERVLALQT